MECAGGPTMWEEKGEATGWVGVEEKQQGRREEPIWMIWLWVLLKIAATVMALLSIPLWTGSLPRQCADPFVVLQVGGFMLTLFFLVAAAALHFTNGNSLFDFVRRVTARGACLMVLAGASNALGGILIVVSSPVGRTPPIISSTFPSIIFLVMILVIWLLHKRRILPEPAIKGRDFLTLEFFLFACLYVLCIYCLVSATIKQAVIEGQVYWWALFVCGSLLGYLFNQLQEVFFKTEDFSGTTNEIANYLFSVMVIQWLFGLFFIWVDFIPGVRTTHGSFECELLQTLQGSFTGMGLLWNLLYALGSCLSYVAAVQTNLLNTGLTLLTNPLSSTLVVAISYDIPALTPDQAVVDVYFFFPMILSGLLMTFFYAQWYKGTRITGSLIHIKDFLQRYDRQESDSDAHKPVN